MIFIAKLCNALEIIGEHFDSNNSIVQLKSELSEWSVLLFAKFLNY